MKNLLKLTANAVPFNNKSQNDSTENLFIQAVRSVQQKNSVLLPASCREQYGTDIYTHTENIRFQAASLSAVSGLLSFFINSTRLMIPGTARTAK